jgi:hypothetical protein
MTEWKNPWKEGDFVAHFRALGSKITKPIIGIDRLMPQLSQEEVHKLHRDLAIYMLLNDDLDPAERRELLKQFDTCPCCQGWLGHNRPPDDDGDPPTPYRRQRSFEF